MKIKNISEQNLNLSLTKVNNENIIVQIKPNQVLYTENTNTINKQLLIYEKKKLIFVIREIDKPDYVNYYKPFFESVSNTNVVKPILDLDDEDEDEITESIVEISNFDFNDSFEDDFNDDGPSVKKGRGRPKGTKKDTIDSSEFKEKKGRGRPKGTVKVVENSTENMEKKGRGRPKGSIKSLETPSENSKKLRGRPKGSKNLNANNLNVGHKINVENNLQTQNEKRGRGRPKKIEFKVKIENEKVLGRKRGRPRKNSVNN